MVPKLSNNPPPAGVKELTVEVLRNLVPARYSVRSEKPITLGESEPEPDVTVVAGTPRDYFDRHPGPEDIALVIEVSDASLNRDRKTKKQIYAKAGILCYWIVDVTSRKVEVYSRPADSAYLSCEEFTAQVPLCIGDQPAVMIEVASLLP
jgi:Uma2 family endonuclease